MRRFSVLVFIFVLGLGLFVGCLRGPIALRVMRVALEANMAADPIGELPDGLHVTLCGAGGPLADTERSGPCLAIVAGRSLYLVDAGSGAARNLIKVGYQPFQVEGVFLTHFHSDHIDGLGELGMLRWVARSHSQPLPLYGPEGIDEISEGLNQAYQFDAAYRTAHHGSKTAPASGAGFSSHAFSEPADGLETVVFEKDGLRVTMFRVDHPPIVPAVGYRFEYGGRTVLISGDTKKSDNLELFAKGVDLLVHEALSPELMAVIQAAAETAGDASLAKIAADVPDYHASPIDAAEIAESAGVGHLLYYHVVPPMPLPGLSSVFMDGVDDAYGGPITLGRDGTSISLPTGSDEIRVLKK
ncbi:MAG: MBL fold metallo-hydrolase [Myxococcota bacterium]